MKYTKILTISKETAEKFQKLLDMEEVDFKGLEVEEDAILASFTARFENGLFVDINVNSGQNNCWVDTILYSPTGDELVLDEPSETLLGESCLFYQGDEYSVVLTIEQETRNVIFKCVCGVVYVSDTLSGTIDDVVKDGGRYTRSGDLHCPECGRQMSNPSADCI